MSQQKHKIIFKLEKPLSTNLLKSINALFKKKKIGFELPKGAHILGQKNNDYSYFLHTPAIEPCLIPKNVLTYLVSLEIAELSFPKIDAEFVIKDVYSINKVIKQYLPQFCFSSQPFLVTGRCPF